MYIFVAGGGVFLLHFSSKAGEASLSSQIIYIYINSNIYLYTY